MVACVWRQRCGTAGAGADTWDRVYSLADGSVRWWRVPEEWHVNSSAIWARAGEVAFSDMARGAFRQRYHRGTLLRVQVDEVFQPGAGPTP